MNEIFFMRAARVTERVQESSRVGARPWGTYVLCIGNYTAAGCVSR